MELRISARNLTVSDRFKEYVADKASKVEQLAHRPQELNIRVTRHEHNRNSGPEDQVELTVYEPGHVVRAEARAADKFAAFDIAFAKLLERLRRYGDKNKIHRGGGHKNLGVSELSATGFSAIDLVPVDADVLLGTGEIEIIEEPVWMGDSPVKIRHKEFESIPMSIEEAIYKMELVGHDFYLFNNSANGKTSVVYKRMSWSYGVISLTD